MSIENCVTSLNEWDKCFLVSTVYSGPARILAGLVQIVAGAVLGVISAVFGWMNGEDDWWRDVKVNCKEFGHGIGNVFRGIIAAVPIVGNIVFSLYHPTFVLRRDADGLYTLPHFDVPGFRNFGVFRGDEINIHAGDFVIDTRNGVVPEGWVLEP